MSSWGHTVCHIPFPRHNQAPECNFDIVKVHLQLPVPLCILVRRTGRLSTDQISASCKCARIQQTAPSLSSVMEFGWILAGIYGILRTGCSCGLGLCVWYTYITGAISRQHITYTGINFMALALSGGQKTQAQLCWERDDNAANRHLQAGSVSRVHSILG